MVILICAIVVLGCVAALIGKLYGREAGPDAAGRSGCASCGGGAECGQECMMEAAVAPVEYYDDEELDGFRGRPSDGYSDEEADVFREILYTMRPDEVAGWTRSLVLRGVSLPDQVKDETALFLA